MLESTPNERALPWLTIIENMKKQKSYKPILLLSIISEIEHGNISENKIFFTKDLEERFNSFYSDLHNDQGIGKIHLPFYFLLTDKAWTFVTKSPNTLIKERNKGDLSNKLAYAQFNDNLFDLLLDNSIRNIIKERLFLKAEEDIKNKDINDNDSPIVLDNIPTVLQENFGSFDRISYEFESDTIKENISSTFQFALEKDLQNTIVQNWDLIPKFQDWKIYEGPPRGVEFPIDEAGRIDILALTKSNSEFIVIELKRNTGVSDNLGQILRYTGWVRTKLAYNQNVRGILIAQNFNQGINHAIQELKDTDIELLRFNFDFQLNSYQISF